MSYEDVNMREIIIDALLENSPLRYATVAEVTKEPAGIQFGVAHLAIDEMQVAK